VRGGKPGDGETGDHDELAGDGDLLRAEAIDQRAADDAQERAGEHRGADQQALLGRIEMQVLGDRDPQRAEQHPDHERQVEIQERGEQGGRMPGLEESSVHRRDPDDRQGAWPCWRVIALVGQRGPSLARGMISIGDAPVSQHRPPLPDLTIAGSI
jgi:hypothetical protein